jgi:hypothetical protein
MRKPYAESGERRAESGERRIVFMTRVVKVKVKRKSKK